jgi:hypothetical protein
MAISEARRIGALDTIRTMLIRWSPLLLVSALSLYLELAVIRWVAGEVRLFSYFKNLTLLSAFLGLAIGFGVAKRQDLRARFPTMLFLLFLLVVGIKQLTAAYPLVYPGDVEEALLWLFTFNHWSAGLLFFAPLLLLFLMVMFVFVPVGQAVAIEMAAHTPLAAYSVNVLASLLGVWLFAVTSALRAPPLLWFGLSVLAFVAYGAHRRFISVLSVGLNGVVLVGIALTTGSAIWSPYQKLVVTENVVERAEGGESMSIGYRIDTQVGFFQHAYDLSPTFVDDVSVELPQLADLAFHYDLPYRFAGEGAEILIVGAGMGNDVAAALRAGVSKIDAVEIDPTIMQAGLDLHPERPYQDPRVNLVVDDARAFLGSSNEQYDAIVFGLLDSHTLLSSLSSVRLDSFVYTEQSLRLAREHLSEDGVISLTFASPEDWIVDRLGRILVNVFGEDRVYILRGELGTTFLAGEVSPSLAGENVLTGWHPEPALGDLPISTDDWPYLYLRSNRIPAMYWQALLLIGVVAFVIMARSFPEVLRPSWHFWFLGAAFLLIEFKSITELALLFGTTWLVNAIAISGVLVMILFANAVVVRAKRINLRVAFALLMLSILFLYFYPIHSLSGLAFTPRLIAAGGLLSLPLFFSGLIFGESLRRAGETSRPLASNLGGAMFGGMLEYGSLIWGIKSLYLMAFGLYFFAWLASRLGRKSA